MIGGTVIETISVPGDNTRAARIWVNCEGDYHDTCAVYVEDCPAARCIDKGDSIWWQAGTIHWSTKSRSLVDYHLKKVGGSGVKRPAAAPNSAAASVSGAQGV